MKKINILNILLLVFAGLFSACSSDLLDQEPSTSMSDETVVNTYETAYTVLMGAYSQMGSYYYMPIGQIGLDVMADDATVTTGSYGIPTYKWHINSYNYNQHAAVVDGWWSAYAPYMWKYAYKAITACNLLINSDLPDGCEDIIAQAHGIRAWNFMNLYHLFCASYTNPTYGGDDGKGLFLRLTQASSDATEDVERSDLKTSLQQIIDDFTYLYENGTETSNEYFNPTSAALFLARIYLEMEDYTNASKYAEIAANNTFDGSNLMSQSEYQSGFMETNSEWLLGFIYDAETTNYYASIPSFYELALTMDEDATFGTSSYGTKVPGDDIDEQMTYLENNGTDYLYGYSTIRFAKSFVDLFGTDANGIFTDSRALFPFYFSLSDGYFTAKFNHNGSLGVADYPLARIAEAYLIEAEAKYETSGTGLDVLNALQEQRGGTISSDIDIDEIWKERRRELYGEGFALTDIKRLQKPIERTGDDQWSDVLTLDANSSRMMYPIPDDELLYNPYYNTGDDAYNEGQNDYWAN